MDSMLSPQGRAQCTGGVGRARRQRGLLLPSSHSNGVGPGPAQQTWRYPCPDRAPIHCEKQTVGNRNRKQVSSRRHKASREKKNSWKQARGTGEAQEHGLKKRDGQKLGSPGPDIKGIGTDSLLHSPTNGEGGSTFLNKNSFQWVF